MLPAGSIACTSNLCRPNPTLARAGEVHDCLKPSSVHRKVDPGSLDRKANLAVRLNVRRGGTLVNSVSGAVRSSGGGGGGGGGTEVSTAKLRDAGVGSELDELSIARTAKVWLPSASAAVV
jgi:hypothetical protein